MVRTGLAGNLKLGRPPGDGNDIRPHKRADLDSRQPHASGSTQDDQGFAFAKLCAVRQG